MMEVQEADILSVHNNFELCELDAIKKFICNYESTYGTDHVTFALKTLRQLIQENIYCPLEAWRVVALYLHHGHDTFAQNWCRELRSKETITILEECCCVVPWDISENTYHETFQETLRTYLKHSFSSFFEHKKSGVLFILQQNGAPYVISILQGNISVTDILYNLTEIRNCLKTEAKEFQIQSRKHEDSQPNIGSEGFQQNMYAMLGDRDYDCFEYDQYDKLKDKIGFALYGPPPKNGYSEKNRKHIDSIFNNIIKQNMYAKYKEQILIACIFNCFEPLPEEKRKKKKKDPNYNPEADIGSEPIFVIKKCYSEEPDHGCRIFIDHENRVYASWNQYKNKNRLHTCVMVLPKNGRYKGDENGSVLLERHNSPACKIISKIANIADISAGGAGLVSGGVVAVAAVPAITIAPVVLIGAAVVGIAAGAVSVVRSSISLADMKKHQQDLNVIRSKEARGAVLSVAAGTLGVLGAGATAAMSTYVSRGANIGKVGQGVVNAINGTNLAVGSVSIGNSIHHVYFSWKYDEEISGLTILQLGASVFFFANSVYSFKTAGAIIEENQNNVLNQMKYELSSNNRRKMFTKMQKETIRLKNGNTQAGNAEVISTVRNIPNKDEIFGILKASNKLFNKKGVKFFASDSQLLFNGEPLNLESFATFSKFQRLQVLSEMPATTPLQTNVTSCSLSIGIFGNLTEKDWINLISIGWRLCTNSTSINHCLQIILQEFSQTVKEKLLIIAMELIKKAVSADIIIFNAMFPSVSERMVFFVNVVKMFVHDFAEQYRREYEESKRRARSSSDFDEVKFDKMYGILSPQIVSNGLFFCEVVIDIMLKKEKVIPKYLDKIYKYFINFIKAKVVADQENETKALQQTHYAERMPKTCNECKGHYFVDKVTKVTSN